MSVLDDLNILLGDDTFKRNRFIESASKDTLKYYLRRMIEDYLALRVEHSEVEPLITVIENIARKVSEKDN